jgi:hypothetical protein
MHELPIGSRTQVVLIDVVNEKASYRGTEWNELLVGKATQPEAYGIESIRLRALGL